ncbi:hypothetical protein YN1_3310 [Nanoarchaeota archaeon]
MKALIAGIDPGTNTALVVIDEEGNIIEKISGKNISNEDIIRYISNLNNVVLIATDKKEIPKSILEISSKLNLGIYSPKRDIDLKTKDKYYTDNKLKNIFENNHEFDAYIAAIEALKKVKDLFEKAKRVAIDEKEYIKILKLIFKKKKIEPVSAKISIEDNNKEMSISTKIRKRRKIKKIDMSDIKIIIKREVKKKNKELKDLNLRYIKLLKDYNELSKILLEKLDIKDNIIPKASFLYSNNLYFKKVFLDKLEEEYIRYFNSKESEFYILEENEDKIKDFLNRYCIVEEFTDIKNYIIINRFRKVEKEDNKKDMDIDKLRKILKDYQVHRSLRG